MKKEVLIPFPRSKVSTFTELSRIADECYVLIPFPRSKVSTE